MIVAVSQKLVMNTQELSFGGTGPLAIPPSTPTGTSEVAEQLFSTVQSTYFALSALTSLAPNETLNEILNELVGLCTKLYGGDSTDKFFAIPGAKHLCSRLRPLLSEAEGELEKHWAERIIETSDALNESSQKSRKLLKTFPYHQNYVELSRLECSILQVFLPSSPQNVAFIGCGSLPLTSLLFADRFPGAVIHNIDQDAVALAVSLELCCKLGYSYSMAHVCEEIGNEYQANVDWSSFQVVFLAALVGTDSASKLSVLSTLASRLRPGTLIMARSAHGLRKVLYPDLELSNDLERIGLSILAEVHPWTDVVNSVIVLRVREN